MNTRKKKKDNISQTSGIVFEFTNVLETNNNPPCNLDTNSTSVTDDVVIDNKKESRKRKKTENFVPFRDEFKTPVYQTNAPVSGVQFTYDQPRHFKSVPDHGVVELLSVEPQDTDDKELKEFREELLRQYEKRIALVKEPLIAFLRKVKKLGSHQDSDIFENVLDSRQILELDNAFRVQRDQKEAIRVAWLLRRELVLTKISQLLASFSTSLIVITLPGTNKVVQVSELLKYQDQLNNIENEKIESSKRIKLNPDGKILIRQAEDYIGISIKETIQNIAEISYTGIETSLLKSLGIQTNMRGSDILTLGLLSAEGKLTSNFAPRSELPDLLTSIIGAGSIQLPGTIVISAGLLAIMNMRVQDIKKHNRHVTHVSISQLRWDLITSPEVSDSFADLLASDLRVRISQNNSLLSSATRITQSLNNKIKTTDFYERLVYNIHQQLTFITVPITPMELKNYPLGYLLLQ